MTPIQALQPLFTVFGALTALWTLVCLCTAFVVARRYVRRRTRALAWSAAGFGLIALTQILAILMSLAHTLYFVPSLDATDPATVTRVTILSTATAAVQQLMLAAGLLTLAVGALRGDADTRRAG